MTPAQRLFALSVSVVVVLALVELVRRRKLKEEYAILWLVTGAGMIGLSTWYAALEWLTHLAGAVTPTTTLFIFGLLFLLLISVHYSIVISRLTTQVRRLTQEVALLSCETAAARDAGPSGAASEADR